MSRRVRGGPQKIPRPAGARPGRPAPWAHLSAEERHLDVKRVRNALATGPPARLWTGEERPGAKNSAVLAALYDDGRKEEVGGAHVILTRRAGHLRSHRGEVSFPGGRVDPGDADLVATALREAHEEIALDPASVEVVGELDHLMTMWSGASIVPFVGALAGPPSELRPNPDEVERILQVPLAELLLDEVFSEEVWPLPGGGERKLWFFALHGDTVWGATAAMLRDLLGRALGLEIEPPQQWGPQPPTGNID
jgi:8-oxo-dGTP pyrophosphatase MutT (NUDIX family)